MIAAVTAAQRGNTAMPKSKLRRRADATGRSIGGDPHVRLHRWLLESPAYRHATLAARALLVELYALHNGVNNGDLFLSVRDAARRLGVGKNRAHDAFQELRDLGFIAVHERGSFHRKVRHATRWRLTEFGCHGALATKDFMRWPPAGEKQNPVHAKRTNGARRGDRAAPTVPLTDTDGADGGDHHGVAKRGDGPSPGDADSLPGEAASRSAKPLASEARSDATGPRHVGEVGDAIVRCLEAQINRRDAA